MKSSVPVRLSAVERSLTPLKRTTATSPAARIVSTSKTRPSLRGERSIAAERQRIAGEGLYAQFALDAVRGADDGHLDRGLKLHVLLTWLSHC